MQTETIIASRLFLARERPYLSMALWALFPIKTPGIGTFAVDKWWRLYYDPDLEWDVKTTAAVLYHEIQHLLRIHPERGEGLDVILTDENGNTISAWNIAADAEINDDIASEGTWALPAECVYPSKLGQPDEKLAEEYYDALIKEAEKNGSVEIPGAVGQDGNPLPGAGNCGSAAGGPKKEWEQEGEENGARKISESEGKLIGRQVAEQVQKTQKAQGNVPAHWQRWADAVINPKVDWRQELRSVVINAVSEIKGMWNYTYRRPGRRSSAFPNIVMPAMTQPIVKVSVVVDTSGSMGQGDLEAALGEIKGILAAVGIQDGVEVISCDAAVHTTQKVYSASQVKLGGGGGTDMRVGIQAALDGKHRPNVIVVLTDGYTPWPSVKPKPVVVCGIIGDPSVAESAPDWARKVVIN